MNLPLLWAEGVLNPNKEDIYKDARKEIPKNFVALAEISDFEQRVRRFKQISVFKWFRGVLRANCLYVWNWRDIKPGLNYWFTKLKNVLKRPYKKKAREV